MRLTTPLLAIALRAKRDWNLPICRGITSISHLANGKFFPSWSQASPTRSLPLIWALARSRSGFTGARLCERWALKRSRSLLGWPTLSEFHASPDLSE